MSQCDNDIFKIVASLHRIRGCAAAPLQHQYNVHLFVIPATVNSTYMPPTHCILHMKQQSKEDLEEEPNVQATREEPPTKIPKKKQKSGGNSNGRTGPNLSEKDSIEYVCPICIEEQCKNGKRLWFLHGEFVKDGKVVMDKQWGQTGKHRSATQKAASGNATTQASLMHRSLLRNNFGTVDRLLPLACLLMCQRNSTTMGVWRSLRSLPTCWRIVWKCY